MKHIFIPALCLILATPVWAQESDLDTVLNNMVSSTGKDYVAARAAAIEAAAGQPQTLASRIDGSTWTTTTWQVDWAAALVDAYLNHRDAVDRVHTARGVQPSFYLKKRRPDPEVGRDFKRTVGETWPVLIEVYTKTFETYPFAHTASADYGKADATERARLRGLELQALKEGILWALPWAKQNGLEHFFSSTMKSTSEAITFRQVAALGLGRTGTDTSVSNLIATLHDGTLPVEIRSACLRGLAQSHSEAAYGAIAGGIASDNDVIRRQSLASVGIFGSAWKWVGRDNTLRKKATALLGGLLLEGADSDSLLDSLILIGHPDAKGYLETAIEKSTSQRLVSAHQRLTWRLSR